MAAQDMGSPAQSYAALEAKLTAAAAADGQLSLAVTDSVPCISEEDQSYS